MTGKRSRRNGALVALLLAFAFCLAPVGAEDPPGERAERSDAARAIEDALAWLAAHQTPGGSWGAALAQHDVGVTGLALLAFLEAGYAPEGDHRYREVLSRGLAWLAAQQDRQGCIGSRDHLRYVYDHAAAAHAVILAYTLAPSAARREVARRAVAFIELARNPYFAWRYGVRPGENDTSVTVWMMVALHAAKRANEAATQRGESAPFSVPVEILDGARTWIDKMTAADTGRVGYIQRGGQSARPQALIDRFPAHHSEAMTAAGLVVRHIVGTAKGRSYVQGLGLLEEKPPRWNREQGSIDMIYWYYGTLAMKAEDPWRWRRWARPLYRAVLPNQRSRGEVGDLRGSWDPAGVWGPTGGRVYATALMARCLIVAEAEDPGFS